MASSTLLSRLNTSMDALESSQFASCTLELAKMLASPTCENAFKLAEEHAVVLRALEMLMQSPSTHFACLGYALIASPGFYVGAPSMASLFFSMDEDGSRSHGSWLAVRPLDLAIARADSSPADAEAAVEQKKIAAAFRCVVAALLEHIARDQLPADALQPCIVQRIMSDVTRHRITAPQICTESLTSLCNVLALCPESSGATGVLPFLLSAYVDYEGIVDEEDLLRAINLMVTNHGLHRLPDCACAPVMVPYMDVFVELDQKLLRARTILSRLPTTWEGIFLLATTAGTGLEQLVRLIHLPGSTHRRVLLIELFLSMLRAVVPHRNIPADGPWTAYLERLTQEHQLSGTITMRARAPTTCVEAFDLVDDETEFRSEGVDGILDDEMEHRGVGTVISAAPPEHSHHTRDVMAATFLLLLNHVGLPASLMEVVRTTTSGYDTALPESAALLLQQIMVLEHSYLPPALVDSMHRDLDKVVASAALAEDPFIGALTTKLFHLVAYAPSNQSESAAIVRHAVGVANGANGNSGGAGARGQPPNAPPSPPIIKQLIKATMVLETSECDRWNYSAIIDMCRNQLRSGVWFAAAKEAKWFERLLNFYKPTHNDRPSQFRALPRRTTVPLCSVAGVALLDLLVSSPEGTQMLLEHQVPAKLTQFLCDAAKHPKGHAELLTTLAGDYLKWLGHLTRTRVGLALLQSANFFDLLTEAFNEPTSHKDTKRAIVNSLHIGSVPGAGVDDRVKVFIAYVMASGDSLIRLSTVARLERFVHAELWAQADWVLDILIALALNNQKENKSAGVVQRSLALVLYVARVSSGGLRLLADKHLAALLSLFSWTSPFVTVLVHIFYELLRIDVAAAMLIKHGWVAEALAHWQRTASSPSGEEGRALWVKYVDDFDAAFDGTLVADETHSDSDQSDTLNSTKSEFDHDELTGEEPPHICGALCATVNGADVLFDSALYHDVVAVLESYTPDDSKRGDDTLMRGALLAIGQMGAHDAAHANLITDQHLVLMDTMRLSPSAMLRVAAVTALSVIARCAMGRERLKSQLGFLPCAKSGAYTASQHAFSTSFAYAGEASSAWLSLAPQPNTLAGLPIVHPPTIVAPETAAVAALLLSGINHAVNSRRLVVLHKLRDMREGKPAAFMSAEAQQLATWCLGTLNLGDTERVLVALLFTSSTTAAQLQTACNLKR
jgi:hypothetical protein